MKGSLLVSGWLIYVIIIWNSSCSSNIKSPNVIIWGCRAHVRRSHREREIFHSTRERPCAVSNTLERPMRSLQYTTWAGDVPDRSNLNVRVIIPFFVPQNRGSGKQIAEILIGGCGMKSLERLNENIGALSYVLYHFTECHNRRRFKIAGILLTVV